jgi:hypothetical protein
MYNTWAISIKNANDMLILPGIFDRNRENVEYIIKVIVSDTIERVEQIRDKIVDIKSWSDVGLKLRCLDNCCDK